MHLFLQMTTIMSPIQCMGYMWPMMKWFTMKIIMTTDWRLQTPTTTTLTAVPNFTQISSRWILDKRQNINPRTMERIFQEVSIMFLKLRTLSLSEMNKIFNHLLIITYLTIHYHTLQSFTIIVYLTIHYHYTPKNSLLALRIGKVFIIECFFHHSISLNSITAHAFLIFFLSFFLYTYSQL